MINDLINSFLTRKDLTYTERKISSFILDNYSEVVDMEAKTLASLCSVGIASVTRFVRKLGFKNYSEFKLALAKDYRDYLSNQLSLDTPFSREATMANILSQLPLMYDKANRITQSLLDSDTLSELVDLMGRSVVLIFASGQNNATAEAFGYKLEGLGIVCKVYESAHSQFVSLLSKSNTRTLAIILTHTGTNPTMVDAVKLLHKYHIKTVVVSGYERDPSLGKMADYHLKFYSGTPENRFANVIWGTAMQYVLDTLAVGIYVKRSNLLDLIANDDDYTPYVKQRDASRRKMNIDK
ncbi:MurR/RpiR family transcriptional regulator [Lacticaseibacillus suibinensis]|uniref:MurR/RpiR family transcriptional regulator n=1 Tax=Lacticaseibacillus suibinensis TaxID=2486011 RepID=UPI000F785056|nr:MurR/RpiR family transcriptional regulator [Lacticaseibacillus suibinensis]